MFDLKTLEDEICKLEGPSEKDDSNDSPESQYSKDDAYCPRGKSKIIRGEGKEAEKVNRRLNGFDSEQCQAKSQLDVFFSSSTTQQELLSIAEVLCLHTGLRLTRLDRRSKSVLIKWYQDNWEQIFPCLRSIQLLDENFKVINLERQLSKKKERMSSPEY